jgi:hypothetical protein
VGLRAACSVRQPRRTWLYVALKVGVVVKERRARAKAEVVRGAGAGAAEKRVRVVEGRRKKEAKSLEAIVAVCVVMWFWSCAILWMSEGRDRVSDLRQFKMAAEPLLHNTNTNPNYHMYRSELLSFRAVVARLTFVIV